MKTNHGVTSIELALIDPPLFNSRMVENRGDEAELTALGESLKVNQLQPVAVSQVDGGRYRLIFGTRRFEAAKLVRMEFIQATVYSGLTESDEAIMNGIENVRRRDLTTYEQARLCAELRAKGKKGPEVGELLGMSKQHVSNLAICYEKLPAQVKKAWKDGEPGTDMNFLRSIITKQVNGKTVGATPEEMIAAYEERLSALSAVIGEEEEDDEDDGDEDGDDDGDGKGEKKGAAAPKKFTVYKERYTKLLKALRAMRAPQMAVDVARYLVGDIEKIRGVNIGDDKRPEKKAAKSKGNGVAAGAA